MKIMLCILCCFFTAVSAQVDSLNSAAALVNQQQTDNKAQLMAALTAVISKKSGLSEDEIRQQAWFDDSFLSVVLRHYYEQVPVNLDYSGLWFHAVTDGSRLNQMLIDRNVPLWPPNRPKTFVWVVEEKTDGDMVHAVGDSAAVYWLNKMLNNKGINHQFYDSMDDDLLAYKPEDVSYLNPDLVAQIFEDYKPGQVLLIKLRHFTSGFSYRMGLFDAADSEAVIENRQFVDLPKGLDFLATSLQQKMAEGQRIDASEFGDHTLSVVINDIDGAEAMLSLWQYLKNQPLIKDFQATHYGQASIQLQVSARVDSDAFIKVLINDGLLNHMPLGVNNRIVFSWQP